jgi:hypothetical protein
LLLNDVPLSAAVTTSSSSLDEYLGFVHSSESHFDLREDIVVSASVSAEQQGVEFLALPSSSCLHRHAPFVFRTPLSFSSVAATEAESLMTVVSTSLENEDNGEESDVSAVTENDPSSSALPPNTSLGQDLKTGPAVQSTECATSPIRHPTKETGTATASVSMVDVCVSGLPCETQTVALSPFPLRVREVELNTSVVETTEADTMTQQVVCLDAALSPIPGPAAQSTDTMTIAMETANVSMVTEAAACQDHSILATADTDSKMTMTDQSGTKHTATTMTPFKLMVKQGKRCMDTYF